MCVRGDRVCERGVCGVVHRCQVLQTSGRQAVIATVQDGVEIGVGFGIGLRLRSGVI